MKKNKVENTILLILIIRGIFLLFFNKFSITSLILGSIIGLILITIYQKLNLKKYKIFNGLMLIIFIIMTILTLNHTTNFIKDNILKNFSYLMIAIPFLSLSIYISIKGYHTYIKTIELSSYIIFTMSLLSLLLLIPYINLNNFVPFDYQLSNNFLKLSLFLLFSYMAINYVNNYQINYKTYSFATLLIISIKLLITGILSKTLENVFDYPYISIFKKISYFDFLERLEGFLSMQFLFDYFFLITLFVIATKFLIINLFKVKKQDR